MNNWQWCRIHKIKYYDYACPLCDGSKVQDPVSKKVKRAYKRKVKTTIYERFHNYGVKFPASVFWDAILVEPIRLNNNVYYKRLDFKDGIVKVFKKSILVTLRANAEIKGLGVRDAERESIRMIMNIVNSLPKSIMVHEPEKVVSVHNSFVNHPTANHDVTVRVGGELRAISDHSKGYSEFEFVHPDHAVNDSEILERFNKDLIVNNPDPLSVQQGKINFIVDVLDKYAEQMNLHLKVESRSLEVLEKISDNIDRLAKPKPVVQRGPLGVVAPSVSRFRRLKKFKGVSG